ncbi:MAG: hypothetical protein V3V84_00665 [Candidatus Bathyarchaeia archaeon]
MKLVKENNEAFNLELKRKTERYEFLCWHIFTQVKEGKELMELLKELYILINPVISKSHKEVYGEFYAGIREGQNDLIRTMHNLSVNFKRNEEK